MFYIGNARNGKIVSNFMLKCKDKLHGNDDAKLWGLCGKSKPSGNEWRVAKLALCRVSRKLMIPSK